MKNQFLQGILSNQEGQDTLEWTAIAALIVLVAIAVIAIVGNYVKQRAAEISW
jgi:Flp pilus assembly pilin Flp